MIKRRTLNKEAVVRRAVEMINASGDPDGLSLVDLAMSLDIKTPSLYNHVTGLDGLHRELHLYTWQHLGQVMREAAAGQTGRKALLALAYAYRTFAQDNPGLYRLVLSSAIAGEDAIHAVRGFRSLIHGFVSLENTGGFAMPYEIEKSFHRAVTAYVDGVLATVKISAG